MAKFVSMLTSRAATRGDPRGDMEWPMVCATMSMLVESRARSLYRSCASQQGVRAAKRGPMDGRLGRPRVYMICLT